MDLWTSWLGTIEGLLSWLAGPAAIGLGTAIVLATILFRIVLLPLSWPVGYRGLIRKRKLDKMAQELRQARDRCVGNPRAYYEEIGKIYRNNGLAVFDGKGLLASLAQLPVFIGMYRVLLTAGESVRFLWIHSLAKPDLFMALVAGASTAVMMAINPDLPENLRIAMIVIPSVIAIVAALQFSSALAVYWTASNCFSMLHTAALHAVIERRIRVGRIKI
jgi:YidC/Oxa1 family membrane protein insertase